MGELNFSTQFSRTTIWYHGTTSTQVASLKEGIDVKYSKRNCDFGIGFYVTSNLSQAIKWAQRKTKDESAFNPAVKPVVLSYQFQDSAKIHPKIFEIDTEYFKFVYENRLKLKARSGRNIHDFPIVFGPVLDGQVIHLEATLNDFFIGNRSLEETAAILLGRYLDDTQLCVCDQKIADSLMVVKEEEYDFAN